jgi:hypothetical protein
LIRPAKNSSVIPAKAGIQWRAKLAAIGYSCWIPGQARNDGIHSVCRSYQQEAIVRDTFKFTRRSKAKKIRRERRGSEGAWCAAIFLQLLI